MLSIREASDANTFYGMLSVSSLPDDQTKPRTLQFIIPALVELETNLLAALQYRKYTLKFMREFKTFFFSPGNKTGTQNLFRSQQCIQHTLKLKK